MSRDSVTMSRDSKILSCNLCAWPIINYESPNPRGWLREFRGLYKGPEGLVLTGVGQFRVSSPRYYVAPPDYNARWDDEGYDDRCLGDAFGTLGSKPVNGRHGYLFHDACWCLLEKYSPHVRATSSLERLFEVLSSLPFPTRGTALSWGHDYGGPVAVHIHDAFPWEDRFADAQSSVPDLPAYTTDPREVAEVADILAEPPQSPPKVGVTTASVVANQPDIFNTLPPELHLAIAIHLPTTDALNARLASRAFRPLGDDWHFWASRFKGRFERAWLFEASERRYVPDWRCLYQRTEAARIGPGLRNRRRIWSTSGTVADTINLRWHQHETAIARPPKPGPSCRVEVGGRLWKNLDARRPGYWFRNGCRLLRKCSLVIPDDLSEFSIAHFQAPDAGYVSGLKFTPISGEAIKFGYWGSTTTEYCIKVNRIWGFVIAVGDRGIQAIKCQTGRDAESHWLGCPDDSPKTRRLALTDGPLDELDMGFDGFKLTQLAANIPLGHVRYVPKEELLRSLGLWYPYIPGPTLSLHESSFLPRGDFLRGYKTLFWTAFGGPGGKYLNHLTRISVAILGDIRCIEFTYNADVPIACRVLGRCGRQLSEKMVDFDIDGPGGEVINAVELGYYYYHPSPREEEGVLSLCKMSTNRQRSCVFSSNPQQRRCHVTKTVTADPGTVITGFYAHQAGQASAFGSAFTAMGVIAEPIDWKSVGEIRIPDMSKDN